MLIVNLKSGNKLVRHHGETLPMLNNEIIESLHADGDELDDIRDIFPAITPKTVTATWGRTFGELIYDNLRNSRHYLR